MYASTLQKTDYFRRGSITGLCLCLGASITEEGFVQSGAGGVLLTLFLFVSQYYIERHIFT